MTDPRQELLDPSTSAQRLFELAQSNPELGPQIAAHPNSYAGLRDWIAQHAAPAAQPAQHTAFSAQPAQYAGPAEQPAQYTNQAEQPAPYTIPAEQPAQYTSPAEQPAAYPGAPQMAPQPAGPGYPGSPVPPGTQGPSGGRRKRTGLIVAIVAVVALVLAGGGIAWALIGSKVGGSPTPQAAATKLVDGLTTFDPLTLFGSLAPSEISGFSTATEQLLKTSVSGEREESLQQITERLKDSVSIKTERIQTEAEKIADGVESVTYTAGTITVDGDEDEVIDALLEFSALRGELTGATSSDSLEYLEDSLRDSIDLPYVFDFEEMASERSSLPISVVTVKEGGSWYVSPVLTIANQSYEDSARYSDVGSLGRSVVEGISSDSPEAAADLADAVVNGDLDDIAAHLPLPERRLLSIYGPVIFDDMNIDGWNRELKLESAEFSAEREGSSARLNIDDLTVSGSLYSGSNDKMRLKFSDHCAELELDNSYQDNTRRVGGCLGDLVPRKIYTELGIDQLAIIAVQEGGGWFVSPLATVADISAIVSARAAELAEAGELQDLLADS